MEDYSQTSDGDDYQYGQSGIHPFINLRMATFLQIYGIISVPFNIFGAIVIVRGSTEAMSGYKWHLLNFQIWSTIFELLMCNFITNLPERNFERARCHGLILTHLGGSVFICVVLASFCVTFLFLSIVQCFAFRHQSLLAPDSMFKLSKKNFLVVVLSLYILLFVGVAIILYTSYRLHIDKIYFTSRLNKPIRHLDRFLQIKRFRWYDLTDEHVNYYELRPEMFKEVVFIPALGIMFLGLVLIITFTASSAYILLSSGENLSAKTKALQWAFIRALCIQTGLPIAVIVVPFMYRLIHAYTVVPNWMGSQDDKMGAFSFMVWDAMHCHGLLSTISLFLLKPYREYVSKLLGIDKLTKSFIRPKQSQTTATEPF